MQKLIRFIKTGWPSNCKSIQDSALQSILVRLVIPEYFRKKLLKQLHQGHPGIERVKAIARSTIYWPNDDIGEYVGRCSSCANARKSPPQAEPHPWQSAEGPWERIHVDYAGPINGSRREKDNQHLQLFKLPSRCIDQLHPICSMVNPLPKY